jgi:hypothetical protein
LGTIVIAVRQSGDRRFVRHEVVERAGLPPHSARSVVVDTAGHMESSLRREIERASREGGRGG